MPAHNSVTPRSVHMKLFINAVDGFRCGVMGVLTGPHSVAPCSAKSRMLLCITSLFRQAASLTSQSQHLPSTVIGRSIRWEKLDA